MEENRKYLFSYKGKRYEGVCTRNPLGIGYTRLFRLFARCLDDNKYFLKNFLENKITDIEEIQESHFYTINDLMVTFPCLSGPVEFLGYETLADYVTMKGVAAEYEDNFIFRVDKLYFENKGRILELTVPYDSEVGVRTSQIRWFHLRFVTKDEFENEHIEMKVGKKVNFAEPTVHNSKTLLNLNGYEIPIMAIKGLRFGEYIVYDAVDPESMLVHGGFRHLYEEPV